MPTAGCAGGSKLCADCNVPIDAIGGIVHHNRTRCSGCQQQKKAKGGVKRKQKSRGGGPPVTRMPVCKEDKSDAKRTVMPTPMAAAHTVQVPAHTARVGKRQRSTDSAPARMQPLVQPTANAGCLGVGNNTISEQRTITAADIVRVKRKLQCKLQDDGTCLINLDDAVKMVEYEIADAMCLEVLLQDDLATAQMPNGEIRKALLNSVRAAMMWTGDSDPTVERTCWGNTRKPNLAEQRATIVADKALTNFALSVIERGREAARQMSRLYVKPGGALHEDQLLVD